MKKELNTLILEPSTNTHVLEAEGEIQAKEGNGFIQIAIPAGMGIVRHGEHGTIATESQFVMKYVQQEYNPVLDVMQNAYD